MLRPVLVLAAAILIGAAVPAARAAPVVGATDRFLAEPSLAGAERQAARVEQAGLSAARLTAVWDRGQTALDPQLLHELADAARAAQDHGLRLFLSIYPAGSSQTPTTGADRQVFAAWAASIAHALPTVRNFIVGNEPNHNRFWLPQFGPEGQDVAAAGFEQLLATTYDALKGVSPKITVWGCGCARSGSDTATGRPTHSPVRFIEDMGAAYRASGRTKPIMDGLAYHPYMRSSSTPPTFRHLAASTTITIADYAHLVRVLGTAFDGTAQPGSTLPILYDEFGVDTTIPAGKRAFYTGRTPASIHPVPPATAARYYDAALRLAACQPTVRGLLVFVFEDERNLARWHSGLYYVDATPRTPTLTTIRRDAQAVRAGTFAQCAFVHSTTRTTVFYKTASRPSATLTCDSACTYRLRVARANGGVAAERFGRLPAATMRTVDMRTRLRPGRYRFTLTVWPAPSGAAPEHDRTRLFRVRAGSWSRPA